MRFRLPWRRTPAPSSFTPPTAYEVVAFLASLGDNAGEVAASLARLGVKGERADAYRCPVAVALRQRFGFDGEHAVRVWPGQVAYDVDSTETVRVPLPEPVAGFIKMFDDDMAFLELAA